MFSLFSNKKNHGEVVLVIDIRSSSVGAGLVYINKEEINILYTIRKKVSFGDNKNSENFSKATFIKLEEIINNIESEGVLKLSDNDLIPNKISYALITYASPWFDSRTKEIKISRKEPFKLTEGMFEKMIEDEIKQMKNTAKDTVIIEKDITNVLINGYQMSNPFNKKLNELEFSFYVSKIARSDIKIIENIISKNLHIKKVFHKTHPLILFSVIKNTFINTDSFILIDIGGEITEISIVENDSLISIATIPIGKNHFIREIGNECTTNIEVAESSFQMYFEGTSHSECVKPVENSINSTGKEWRAQIIESIKLAYGDEKQIPNNFFITSDKDFELAFKKLLEDEEMKNFINKEKDYSIIALNQNSMNNLFKYESGVKEDIFLSMTSAYINIMNRFNS